MQKNINYIKQKLSGVYDDSEIESLIGWILEYVTGFSQIEMLLNRDIHLNNKQIKQVSDIVERLLNFEPIQYITGKISFSDLDIIVRPGVLIPRPETEEMVRYIRDEIKHNHLTILDICTGTGCIALALKKDCDNVNVLGCDISESALITAKENADLNGLDAHFFYYDILTSNGELAIEKFDIIVSNPPYVTESEKQFMGKNVLNFEPELALFVPDNDPLLFYRSILDFCRIHLRNGGKVWFEINAKMDIMMTHLLKSYNYNNIESISDIFGKNRFITAKKTKA